MCHTFYRFIFTFFSSLFQLCDAFVEGELICRTICVSNTLVSAAFIEIKYRLRACCTSSVQTGFEMFWDVWEKVPWSKIHPPSWLSLIKQIIPGFSYPNNSWRSLSAQHPWSGWRSFPLYSSCHCRQMLNGGGWDIRLALGLVKIQADLSGQQKLTQGKGTISSYQCCSCIGRGGFGYNWAIYLILLATWEHCRIFCRDVWDPGPHNRCYTPFNITCQRFWLHVSC